MQTRGGRTEGESVLISTPCDRREKRHFGTVAQRGRAVRMAVDQVMGADAAALRDGGEVAFFPPVTGG
jgi:molybdopterin converting factor small subunit